MCLKLDQVGSPSLSFKASEKLGCASKKLQNHFYVFSDLSTTDNRVSVSLSRTA